MCDFRYCRKVGTMLGIKIRLRWWYFKLRSGVLRTPDVELLTCLDCGKLFNFIRACSNDICVKCYTDLIIEEESNNVGT